MKKSCKSTTQEHPKICEDFGKTKNEDPGGLRRLNSRRNFVPKFQYKSLEDKNLK